MRQSHSSVRKPNSLMILPREACIDLFNVPKGSTWNIQPVRILTGDFETSLNAPGFSISLCNISAASRESGTAVTELLELLDAPTTAVSWPNITPPKAQTQPTKQVAEDTDSAAKDNGEDISST